MKPLVVKNLHYQMPNRWNSENTFIVYIAETRALSLLEISVHLNLNSELPKDRFIVEIDIPDNLKVQILNIEDLPESWNAKNHRL